MNIWLALLVAPSMVLIDLSVSHALATPACASQREQFLLWVTLASLAVAAFVTAMAWAESRRPIRQSDPDVPGGDVASGQRHRFMARVATWTGLLSCLVIVAMSIPRWILSPCIA
jgi:hypothetical protein